MYYNYILIQSKENRFKFGFSKTPLSRIKHLESIWGKFDEIIMYKVDNALCKEKSLHNLCNEYRIKDIPKKDGYTEFFYKDSALTMFKEFITANKAFTKVHLDMVTDETTSKKPMKKIESNKENKRNKYMFLQLAYNLDNKEKNSFLFFKRETWRTLHNFKLFSLFKLERDYNFKTNNDNTQKFYCSNISEPFYKKLELWKNRIKKKEMEWLMESSYNGTNKSIILYYLKENYHKLKYKKQYITISIEEFKKELNMVGLYKGFNEFKHKVLIPSFPPTYKYEVIRKGNKVTHIKISIT